MGSCPASFAPVSRSWRGGRTASPSCGACCGGADAQLTRRASVPQDARRGIPMTVALDGEHLELEAVRAVARGERVELTRAGRQRLLRAASALESAVGRGEALYGINTGFGPFARTRIDSTQIETLQANLIRSHSVGYGDALAVDVVRAMLVLRAHSLARGYSGVGPQLVEALVALL